MKVVALVSGGKDSCYNMQLCQSYGHEVVALANLLPLSDTIDELDSFMYQTVGHQVVAALAQCMGLPLFRRRIRGTPRAKELKYDATEGDEVEDLEVLLRAVKRSVPGIGGVSSGAIASDYQRLRVENVCSRLGLVSLAFMWKQEQASLLQNMIDSGLQAVLVKVAALGLDPRKHLGKDLATLQPLLMNLHDLYGCNVCGEGGEYESLTLDSPLFKNAKIILEEYTVHLQSPDSIAPVGLLHPTKFHLEFKSADPGLNFTELLHEVTNESHWIQDNEGELRSGILAVPPVCSGSIKGQEGGDQFEFAVNRQRNGFVSLSCWRQGVHSEGGDVGCELDGILRKIETKLKGEKLSWANVLYVHLYLGNMKQFSKANEIYVQHINERDSVRGVPSRCCVEVPLRQATMGHAMVEILATTDQIKKVLHVQSISSWAPCCIGPYSQATGHQQLLHMAGQLGLDPPTMTLVPGGATSEIAQALKNCEKVGKVFNSTYWKHVLSLTVYCTTAAVMGMHNVGGVVENFLSSEAPLLTRIQGSIVPRPLFIYIQLPELPKGALVEVAPLTYMPRPYHDSNYDDNAGEEADKASLWQCTDEESCTGSKLSEDVQERSSCTGLILRESLCRAFAFCSSSAIGAAGQESVSEVSYNIEIALGQAFELLSNVLARAALDWADVFVLRVYFVIEKINQDELRAALAAAFGSGGSLLAKTPQPIVIPVLGIGETPKMQDWIAVELTASGM